MEAGLSKAALARRVGVSDVTISYWESGTIKQIGHERLLVGQVTGGICYTTAQCTFPTADDKAPLLLYKIVSIDGRD